MCYFRFLTIIMGKIIKVCDEALTAVCAADTGKHIAVGSIHGDVRFIQMSDLMSDFDKGEK